MIQCDALHKFKNECPVSLHFPITHLVSPSVFETCNMMFGSVLQLKGIPFDTEGHEVLNRLKNIWHQTILNIGSEYAIYVTLHRRKQNSLLPGVFNNSLLQEINDRYHQGFNNKSIFVNDIYLTVLTRGLKDKGWFGRISNKFIEKTYEWKRAEQLKNLDKIVCQTKTALSEFGPSLLGMNDRQVGHSELLKFLSVFLNGDYCWSPQFFYPKGHLGSYLSASRISFGKAIEIAGDEKKYFAAMVSIKKYAAETKCSVMDSFLKLNSEAVLTNSFFIEEKDSAQRLITRHQVKLKNVNDASQSQINALTEVRDHLASDRIMMGLHHNTVMLIENNIEKLNQAVAETIKYYAEQGFMAVRETIGQEPAFWAQIPGNIKMIARRSLITSENFSDFCPLHNYRTGYRDQNHLGAAVTILRTPSNTPYLFNFHAKGNSNNPSKGHTTIIGGNGSGKTVAMAFLDAQVSRYKGRTFAFDRDRGLEIYLRACGGYYAILSPEFSNQINFNPFQLADTAQNRKFCREWMSQLIKEEQEISLPAEISSAINQCVDYVFEALSFKDRRLSNAAKLLPIDFPRWPHLRRWLRSDGVHSEGEYAYLFDNEKDDFQMQDKMGFDMTHFLDTEPRSVLVAVTMYLFHRLESSFDGRLVTVLLDEGWQYLDNPYWTQKLRKWLPTLRKLNCHLILATQSPSSVVESSIRNMILDNTATHIYFPNPQAQKEHYQGGFNLTESEYQWIKEMNPSTRYFLLKQDHESSLCCLDLSDLADLLPIFSANRSSLLRLNKLRQKYSDDPKDWLDKFRLEVE